MGLHIRQRHASSNEYSDDYSTPEPKPDSPNARSEAVHTRVDPTHGHTTRAPSEMCMRIDPTPGAARHGIAPCPANTHTRGAPKAGHTLHVSLNTQLLFEHCQGSTRRAHPSTGVNHRGHILVHEHYCRGHSHPLISSQLTAAGVKHPRQ